jgi:type 1 fimbriae regulatory protein FimB
MFGRGHDGAQPTAGTSCGLSNATSSSARAAYPSERGEQFTRQGLAYIIREAGTRAKLGHVWPHMLRHSCGYHLANRTQVPDLRLIQDYLGHKNIRNTARYTRTSARRFEGLWD